MMLSNYGMIRAVSLQIYDSVLLAMMRALDAEVDVGLLCGKYELCDIQVHARSQYRPHISVYSCVKFLR